MPHTHPIQYWDPDQHACDGQLELPVFALDRSEELLESLAALEAVIDKVQLSAEEVELLRRFRKTTAENRRMILQILGR